MTTWNQIESNYVHLDIVEGMESGIGYFFPFLIPHFAKMVGGPFVTNKTMDNHFSIGNPPQLLNSIVYSSVLK